MNSYFKWCIALFSGSVLVGCGATNLVSTPIANIDAIPLKISELTEEERKKLGSFRSIDGYHSRHEFG